MVKEAIAIMANMSPSSSQWLVNISSKGLQVVVADHDQASPGLETRNADPETVTSPEPTQEPSPEPTSVCLYAQGTQIYLQVTPNRAIEPDQRPEYLKVILPQDFYVESMSRLPLPPSPALPAASASTSARPVEPILSTRI